MLEGQPVKAYIRLYDSWGSHDDASMMSCCVFRWFELTFLFHIYIYRVTWWPVVNLVRGHHSICLTSSALVVTANAQDSFHFSAVVPHPPCFYDTTCWAESKQSVDIKTARRSAFLRISVAFSHNINIIVPCGPKAACARDEHAGSQTGALWGRGWGHRHIF